MVNEKAINRKDKAETEKALYWPVKETCWAVFLTSLSFLSFLFLMI